MNQVPSWYKHSRGEKLVASGSQGQIIQRLQIVPIQALIAMASGVPVGDLQALADLLSKRAKNLRVNCQCCGGTIDQFAYSKTMDEVFKFGTGHLCDCSLVSMAIDVLSQITEEPFNEAFLKRETRRLKLERRRAETN